jgi:hypothetical protein
MERRRRGVQCCIWNRRSKRAHRFSVHAAIARRKIQRTIVQSFPRPVMEHTLCPFSSCHCQKTRQLWLPALAPQFLPRLFSPASDARTTNAHRLSAAPKGARRRSLIDTDSRVSAAVFAKACAGVQRESQQGHDRPERLTPVTGRSDVGAPRRGKFSASLTSIGKGMRVSCRGAETRQTA